MTKKCVPDSVLISRVQAAVIATQVCFPGMGESIKRCDSIQVALTKYAEMLVLVNCYLRNYIPIEAAALIAQIEAALAAMLAQIAASLSLLQTSIANDEAAMVAEITSQLAAMQAQLAADTASMNTEIGTAQATMNGQIATALAAMTASLNTSMSDIPTATPVSITVLSGAGVGASASVTGDRRGGVITLNTGTGCVGNADLFRINYGFVYAGKRSAIGLQPMNLITADYGYCVLAEQQDNLFRIRSKTLPLTDSSVYVWGWVPSIPSTLIPAT